MKLFKANSVEIVRECQKLLNFKLPSIQSAKRCNKFEIKYDAYMTTFCVKFLLKNSSFLFLYLMHCLILFVLFSFFLVSTILWWTKMIILFS